MVKSVLEPNRPPWQAEVLTFTSIIPPRVGLWLAGLAFAGIALKTYGRLARKAKEFKYSPMKLEVLWAENTVATRHDHDKIVGHRYVTTAVGSLTRLGG